MTGLDSFTNPQDIGALYPLQGLEIPLAIGGVVLWILWHVKQTREENRDYDEALDLYRRVGMERAMHFGGSSRIATDEDIEQVRLQEVEPDTGEAATTGAAGDGGDTPTGTTTQAPP